MQEWYLGWEKVSCLERCPQFRSVLIEKERSVDYLSAFLSNPSITDVLVCQKSLSLPKRS